MRKRLVELGVMDQGGEVAATAQQTASLYALYLKAGGDTRSTDALREEAMRKIDVLRQRGYDLGYGHDVDYAALPEVEARMEAIYAHARRALYATLDEGVLNKVSPRRLRVRSRALDREDYLAHPASGELIRDEDASRLIKLYASRRPQVQIVLSDGLNANALNENLRAVLPALRHELAEAGFHVGEVDVVVENGRVRAGYHVGALLDVDVVIHLIGERPGTGLNTLSAYLTYGRDPAGHSRWTPDLEHACTTAICGIHRQGKRPAVAVDEIARCVKRMFEKRCSGVALGAESGTGFSLWNFTD
jgi:ethanolamine ammonia-lyase small subunit